MKKNALALVALTGVLGFSLTYVAPVMAEDMSGNNQTNSTSSSDTAGSNQDNLQNSNDNTSSNSGSADETGSPDTATGDDDY